jgi:DeoR/GlpR family transcriptional regulator of sugar metabolism
MPPGGPVSENPAPTDAAVRESTPSTPPKLVETLATSFAAGIATALPAATLVVLQKPTWVVAIAILVTCVAVGVGTYGFLSGRRRRSLDRQAGQQRGMVTVSEPGSGDVRQEMSNLVFAVLWNRADPSEPMNPLTLADLLTHRSPQLVPDSSPEDVVRFVEEVRLLHILPTLERNRVGYFLNGDDFHFKKAIAHEGKKQIALAAASYIDPGTSVAFDGGSTTLEVVRVLITRIVAKTLYNIRITTSSIQICTEILGVHECREAIQAGDLEVWSMAGPLHPSCWTMDPPSSERLPWPIDLAVIGANAITGTGFYLPNEHGFEVKKTFIKQARETLVIADSSKIGRRLPELFATWDDGVKLITDRPADRGQRRVLQSFPRQSLLYSSDILQRQRSET